MAQTDDGHGRRWRRRRGLMAWGLLRGYQLRFAAVLAGNPLGQFLPEHPALASTFYIFITLATPIIGAAALLYGVARGIEARTWRRVRERFEALRTAEVHLARQVQTEQEHLDEFDKRKQAECRSGARSSPSSMNAGGGTVRAGKRSRSVLWKSILGGAVRDTIWYSSCP